MDAEKINIYEACDQAIRAMDREIVKEFGQLKLARFDQLDIVRDVTKMYHQLAKRARKRYFEIGFEAYLLGMEMCDMPRRKAQQKAEKAITMDWVDEILDRTDFVTLFRFNAETERKAQRLVESLAATEQRDAEIDKAMRLWSRQVGQYAVNFTDYAVLQAFQDAGIEMVEWLTEHDDKVCGECHELDRQVFRVDEVPRKPHWNCRCRIVPASRTEAD